MLIVLVVLFIVAVLMVDLALTAETARRSARNASSEFLMDARIEGHYAVVIAQLVYDRKQNKTESLNDRWARKEYTHVEGSREEAAADDPERPDLRERNEEDPDAGEDRVVGDTGEISVEVAVEDEARKFNLNALMDEDQPRRNAARERFAFLIDRYREDTPLDVSSTRAADLRDRVVEYLERKAPAEGARGQMPVAKANKYRILTPDELLDVKGFEDPDHGWGAAFLLYDARDPDEVLDYMERDEEEAEKPKVYPGLLRYLTLWSGDAWPDSKSPKAPDMATWHRINLNTAEKPVLESLFWENPQDVSVVERIMEYRDQEKEGSTPSDGGEIADDEPLPEKQVIEKLSDLWEKIEGVSQEIFDRNKVTEASVTFTCDTFSLDFRASRDKAFKQVRYIVRRNDKGVQTLLREVRADPRYEEDPQEGEEEEEP